MKKILLFTGLITFFLIAGKISQVQAASLCCPVGYGTSWWQCPFGADTDVECCRRNGLFNYDVVDKIECSEPNPSPGLAGEDVSKEVLDSFNPLIQMQAPDADPGLAEKLSTPGGVISRLLGVFAFPLAGLILFVMLIWGGIEMMAGSATSKSVDAGKQRVTTALLGFLLLFSAFWIARILEMVFGIKIL